MQSNYDDEWKQFHFSNKRIKILANHIGGARGGNCGQKAVGAQDATCELKGIIHVPVKKSK